MKQICKNKIPQGAKLVFEGIVHEVYHWEQEMFDGSLVNFERLKRSDTATIIAVVGKKIILQEQSQPHRGSFLSLPGGRCEKGETPKDSAARELLEETGYASEDLILWKTVVPSCSIVWENHYFIARDCQKRQKPHPDNGEKIKNKLISFEDFLLLSENEQFRHKDLVGFLYRLRLHPKEKKAFKRLLIGK